MLITINSGLIKEEQTKNKENALLMKLNFSVAFCGNIQENEQELT